MYEPLFDLSWNLPSGLELKIKLREEWQLFSDITINGEYRFASGYLLSLKRPVTFLDLGANVGFVTWDIANQLLLGKVPFKALLVEPNPDTFNELQARVKSQAPIFKDNIIVPICGLVGERKGTGFLRIDGHHTVARAYSTPDDKGFYVETPYVDLMDYLEPGDIIDLIKMDIEGSEYQFVAEYSDLIHRTNCVVLEIHPDARYDDNWLKDVFFNYGLTKNKILRIAGNVSTQAFYRPTPLTV